MANPLENEEQLYQEIEKQNLVMHFLIWDLIYHRIGDDISVINLLASYYIEQGTAIPIKDARRILRHTQNVREVMNKILHPMLDRAMEKEEDADFARLTREEMRVPDLIIEFLTHYISNDICAINFCVSYYLDPGYEEPIPVKDAAKILKATQSIRQFLDRLRAATLKVRKKDQDHD